MSSFSDYAAHYDLFYRGKDYAAEADFVLGLIRKHRADAESLLELGCGTGSHAVHFVGQGLQVLGVDMSEGMVQRARNRFAAFDEEMWGRFTAMQGDASCFLSPRKVDAVVSLFHVASYQTSNAALAGYFASARGALEEGGLFLFDFWYGPAVLTDRPYDRQREEQAPDGAVVTRSVTPRMRINENIVEVHYDFVVAKGGATQNFSETHVMRYLFLPEIELLAGAAGFRLVQSGAWLATQPLDDKTWYGFAALVAV